MADDHKSQDMIATLKRLSQKYEANLGNTNTAPDEDRRRASRYMPVVSRHQEQEALLEDRSTPPEVSPSLTLRSKVELTSHLGQNNDGGEK
jgi:hypothetical protein